MTRNRFQPGSFSTVLSQRQKLYLLASWSPPYKSIFLSIFSVKYIVNHFYTHCRLKNRKPRRSLLLRFLHHPDQVFDSLFLWFRQRTPLSEHGLLLFCQFDHAVLGKKLSQGHAEGTADCFDGGYGRSGIPVNIRWYYCFSFFIKSIPWIMLQNKCLAMLNNWFAECLTM